jgi:hypothetical protein
MAYAIKSRHLDWPAAQRPNAADPTEMFDGYQKLAMANYVIPTAQSSKLVATDLTTIGICVAEHTMDILTFSLASEGQFICLSQNTFSCARFQLRTKSPSSFNLSFQSFPCASHPDRPN